MKFNFKYIALALCVLSTGAQAHRNSPYQHDPMGVKQDHEQRRRDRDDVLDRQRERLRQHTEDGRRQIEERQRKSDRTDAYLNRVYGRS